LKVALLVQKAPKTSKKRNVRIKSATTDPTADTNICSNILIECTEWEKEIKGVFQKQKYCK
jgi:hypothetical protein